MKIMIDDQLVLELTPLQQRMLSCRNGGVAQARDIAKHYIMWVLQQRMNENVAQVYNEWKDKLLERDVKQIPIKLDELAEFIFNQKDYEDSVPKGEGTD